MAGRSLSASCLNDAIKIAQGLAMVLIVLFHTNDLLYRLGYSFDCSRDLVIIFGPALLSLFFFLAGRSFRQRSRSSLANFAVNRTSSYLWIFLIWNLIHMAAMALLKYSQLPLAAALNSIYLNMTATFNVRDILKFLIFPGNATWFVYYIFVYLVISYVFVVYNGVIALTIGIFFLDIIAWYFGKSYLCVMFQYFEIFMLAYLFGDYIISAIERSSFLMRLIVLVAYVISCYIVSDTVPRDFPIVSTIVRLAGLISLIHFGLIIRNMPTSRLFLPLSNFVLPIYLMHPILLYFVVSLFRAMKFTADSFLFKVVSTPILAFVCIVSCIFVFKYNKLAGLLIFRPKAFRPMTFLSRLDRAAT